MPKSDYLRPARSWISVHGYVAFYATAAMVALVPILVPRIPVYPDAGPVPAAFYIGALILALIGRWRQQLSDDGAADFVELAVLAGSGLLLLLGIRAIANRSFDLGGLQVEPTDGNVASDLGNAIVGGLVVSVAILLIDRASSRRGARRADTSAEFAAQQQAVMLIATQESLLNADLSGRDFSWWYFRKMALHGLRARRSCFFRANLEDVKAQKAELQDADLTNAFCDGADFSDAHFERCCFDQARLRRASMRNALLPHTRFNGAYLNDADFMSANLVGAQFGNADVTGAIFIGADLRGADLSQTRGGATSQFRGALIDTKTNLPDGVNRSVCDSNPPAPPPKPERSTTPLPPESPVCARAHTAEMAWIEKIRSRFAQDPAFTVGRHRPSRSDLRRAGIKPDKGRFYPPK